MEAISLIVAQTFIWTYGWTDLNVSLYRHDRKLQLCLAEAHNSESLILASQNSVYFR